MGVLREERYTARCVTKEEKSKQLLVASPSSESCTDLRSYTCVLVFSVWVVCLFTPTNVHNSDILYIYFTLYVVPSV